MVRLVGLIAALAAPATAATHSGVDLHIGSLQITQPRLLIASFDAEKGSVEYSGEYQVVASGNVWHVKSKGGCENRWAVSQQFELSPELCFQMDYSILGVFAVNCGSFSKTLGGVEKVAFTESGRDYPHVFINFNTGVVFFTRPGAKQPKYALQEGGLLNIEGKEPKRLTTLKRVYLNEGTLVGLMSGPNTFKIRPDLGVIVVHGKSYIRSSWSADDQLMYPKNTLEGV